MGLQFDIELVPQPGSDPKDENRLPSELCRGPFLPRPNVSRDERAPACPFAQLLRGKAGQLRRARCRDVPQPNLL